MRMLHCPACAELMELMGMRMTVEDTAGAHIGPLERVVPGGREV